MVHSCLDRVPYLSIGKMRHRRQQTMRDATSTGGGRPQYSPSSRAQ